MASTQPKVRVMADCEVLRVLVRKGETGFTVMEVRPLPGSLGVESTTSTIKLVGEWPVLYRAGQRVSVVGVWDHGKYGPQVRVSGISEVRPLTLDELEEYLCSGVFFGIGRVLAKRIVAHFGDSTLRVLQHTPERLREVSGIGTHTVEAIVQSSQIQAGQAQALGSLLVLGLSPVMAGKVLHHFGPQAGEVIRHAPYRLTEVDGFGFCRADEFARGLGIGLEDPARVIAGIRYILSRESDKGHSCMSTRALVTVVATELTVSERVVERFLDQARESGTVSSRDTQVYLSEFHDAERTIEQVVYRLMAMPIRSASVVSGAEVSSQLTAIQREAVRRAVMYPLSVITGLPGTGKTTVVKDVVRVAATLGWRLALVSPNWQSARRLSQVTGHEATSIHQLLQWRVGEAPQRHALNPLDVDLIVVDEAGTADVVAVAHLLQAMTLGRTGIVFVGDINQLSSVGCGQVLKDVIAAGVCPVTQLLEVHRQAATSRIISFAHEVYEGRVAQMLSGRQGDCEWVLESSGGLVLQQRVVEVARAARAEFGSVQVLSPMHRGPVGTVELNRALHMDLVGSSTVVVSGFGVGDRVMTTVPWPDLDVDRNTIGEVVACAPESQRLSLEMEGRRIDITDDRATELVLAHCVTCHRAIGSEYPAVVLVLDTSHYLMLRRDVLYTAITRASRYLCYVGSTKALYVAARNQKATERSSGLFRRPHHSSLSHAVR